MKKVFLILLVSFFSFNFAQAATSDVAQLVFSTAPQTVGEGALSETIYIQTQDGSGTAASVSETQHFNLRSSSPSGAFVNSSGNAITNFYIAKGDSRRSFYYRDSSSGSYTLTATGVENPAWSATQSITVGAGGDNQSQLSNTDNNNNSGDSNDSDAENNSESGSSLSAHEAVSTANSAGLGTRKVSVNAGRKRLASVGAPVEFRAVTSGFRETDGSLELLWSFGDGAHAYGKVVRHIYALPGTYQVVLNANQADTNQAVSRTSVEVIKPEIKINQATPEFIELKNNSKQEVNLSFWKLKHHGQEFIFPIDTIIAANNSIKLPAGISYLRPDSADMLTLAYPDGQLAIMPKVIPVADQSGTKNNQELAQVLNQVKLALQKKPNNHAQQILTQTPVPVRAVNQTAQVTQAIKSESDLQTVKIGEQNNQTSKKWWQKLFSL
ncbi:MAG: PKD domain-containing protein [Patescibacteria group bacterium]